MLVVFFFEGKVEDLCKNDCHPCKSDWQLAGTLLFFATRQTGLRVSHYKSCVGTNIPSSWYINTCLSLPATETLSVFCFILGDHRHHQEWFDRECIPTFHQEDQIPSCMAQDQEWDLDLVQGWIMALDLVPDHAFHQDPMDHFLDQCLDHRMDHSSHQVRFFVDLPFLVSWLLL